MDDFGFEEAIDNLCESIVIAVPDAADGGFDAGVGQTLSAGSMDPVITFRTYMLVCPRSPA
ncbi:hypothetical protein GCM10011534_42530 [Pseudooceanicola nanhaiensis]|jgi:hypothetical protein|uniref:Uncharacterized protein n=1 Tax=Pseudooceanicola nanhaiensis TaxID=375761 RepID=A0A917TBE2_9RHOB|nr:hypothetical protein GCM10011534_42530 [Pseudooceanicola nanhaiensis]